MLYTYCMYVHTYVVGLVISEGMQPLKTASYYNTQKYDKYKSHLDILQLHLWNKNDHPNQNLGNL